MVGKVLIEWIFSSGEATAQDRAEVWKLPEDFF